jgi:hypothetical protein
MVGGVCLFIVVIIFTKAECIFQEKQKFTNWQQNTVYIKDFAKLCAAGDQSADSNG